MTVPGVLALVVAGTAAGILSTVASIASLVSYPALLAFGLPPLSANMTNTVALMFTGAGAAAGSRPELAGQGARVRRLGPVTAAGGGAGAALLLLTPAGAFVRVAPVLIGAASLTLLTPLLPRRPPPGEPPRGGPPRGLSRPRRGLLLVALFASAVYVGYFGAAGGILLLAILIALLAEPVARANALKNVINGFANAVASVAFALFGSVDWAVVPPLAAGFLLGGLTGPALARRLPGRVLRTVIGISGLGVAVKLSLTAYQ